MKRRLELSYPDQYKIKIKDRPEVYFVQLNLTLSDRIPTHKAAFARDLQQTGTASEANGIANGR